MSILHKLRCVLLMALLLPLHACGVPFWYKAEPIEAWVADAETNQPLEGVIVVAHWQLKGGLEGGNPVGQMMVMETVTDTKGRFYFPGWGPKLRSLKGDLKDQSPGILLFKSGYEYLGLQNYPTNKTIRGDLDNPLRSEWNGKTIKLERFKGGLEKYEELFEDFNHALDRMATDQPDKCNWKNIPMTIRAMNQERKRLIALGVTTNTLSTIDNELLMNDPFYTKKGGCGSPKEFFKGFQE